MADPTAGRLIEWAKDPGPLGSAVCMLRHAAKTDHSVTLWSEEVQALLAALTADARPRGEEGRGRLIEEIRGAYWAWRDSGDVARRSAAYSEEGFSAGYLAALAASRPEQVGKPAHWMVEFTRDGEWIEAMNSPFKLEILAQQEARLRESYGSKTRITPLYRAAPPPLEAPICPRCPPIEYMEAQFVCEHCGHREAIPAAPPPLATSVEEVAELREEIEELKQVVRNYDAAEYARLNAPQTEEVEASWISMRQTHKAIPLDAVHSPQETREPDGWIVEALFDGCWVRRLELCDDRQYAERVGAAFHEGNRPWRVVDYYEGAPPPVEGAREAELRVMFDAGQEAGAIAEQMVELEDIGRFIDAAFRRALEATKEG